MFQSKSSRQRKERGQSFMELAVSITFLLIILSVMVDLGWAFYTLIAMRDAVQEAASYGAMCPQDLTKIEERLRESTQAPLDIADVDQIRIAFYDPHGVSAPAVRGNSIMVEITVNHKIIVPFVATFIGTPTYPLRASVTDTVLRDITIGCR